MDETEFSRIIDARFPYHDPAEAIELIEIANSISHNAAFMVLEEICRPPFDVEVSTKTIIALIDLWKDRTSHPLVHSVVKAARTIAMGSNQSVNGALQLMKEVAPFTGQYCALNIAYYSCDDINGEIEAAKDEICRLWEC